MSHTKTNIAGLEKIVPILLGATNIQPLGLIGPAGIAKTQWLKSRFVEIYADSLGLSVDKLGFIQERVANRDSAEIAGVALPVKDAQGNVKTQFTVPPLISKIEATGREYGVILFDELLQAGADVQKVLADVLDPEERTLAGWAIPDGWIVAFTGNRVQDKSGATRMLSHLLNRVAVFVLDFDIAVWSHWAEDNGINPLVIDCAVTYHGEGFFADSVPTEDGAFCTPRSLVRAAEHLTAFMDTPEFDGAYIPSYVENLLAANIGAKAAGILVRHIAMADQVPAGKDIHANPEAANVPDQTGYQLLAANRAINSAYDGQTGDATLRYITRLRPDLQVSLGSKLLRVSASRGWVLTSPAATQFIQKFHDLIPLADAAGWR